MIPARPILAAALAVASTAPAWSQARARIGPGAHVVVARDYVAETDGFTDGPRHGDGEACFRITAVTEEGAFLDHLTGPDRTWWTDEVFAPGTFDDVWFTSDAYRDNHPEAGLTEMLELIVENVPSCPEETA